MPYLEFEHETKPLGPGVLTIGSGSEAAWRIPGRDLAPLHAIVTLEKGGYALVAAGSPQATIYVNGVEAAGGRGIVRYGDAVRLGRAEFRFIQLASGNDGRGGYLREMRRGRSYKLGDFTEIGRDPRCGDRDRTRIRDKCQRLLRRAKAIRVPRHPQRGDRARRRGCCGAGAGGACERSWRRLRRTRGAPRLTLTNTSTTSRSPPRGLARES